MKRYWSSSQGYDKHRIKVLRLQTCSQPNKDWILKLNSAYTFSRIPVRQRQHATTATRCLILALQVFLDS
eukprot:3643411-Pleurochrysis_carterae.AAC.1